MAMRNRRYRSRPHVESGAGKYAPSISFVYQNEQVQIELKKNIQNGEERTLILTSDEFFQISFESNEIRQVGNAIAAFGQPGAKRDNETFRQFKMIVNQNDDRKDEHLYKWKVNDTLSVLVRNRRNDGRRPTDAEFVVEIRRLSANNEGIMMAWHNFEGTFVHHRQERRDRVREMEQQIRSTPSASTSLLSTTSFRTEKLTEAEQSVEQCVVCMDKFGKEEEVTRMTKCQHKFHRNCIETWLRGSDHCPLCRTKVNGS